MIIVLSHGRLLDCVGDEPGEDVSIVVEGREIKDIYSGKRQPPREATVIDVGGKTILPGLTDAHCHCAWADHGLLRYNAPPIRNAVKIIRNLELDLEAGFTTLCDKGGANWALKQAIDEGLIKAPRLIICCSGISKTGGHGDFSNFRDGLGEVYAKDTGLVALQRLADGVDECRKAAREQLRNGADFVKFRVTGGAGSPNDAMTDIAYSEQEIRAFVEEAEDNGKYVSAHCLSKEGAKRAIRCGVRSIEHGAYFDEETVLMLKRRDFFHVPTLMIYQMIAERGKELNAPDYFIKKSAAVLKECMRTAELTYSLKANVAFGTDWGLPFWRGMQGVEFKLRTECGMTPYETIKAATVVNSRLFRMEQKIGTVEIGKWADIIVVDGKPDDDIELLHGPAHVRLVMKNGEIIKNTL